MMKKVSIKNIKTKLIEVELSRMNKIKSSVHITSKGVGCYKREQEISLNLNSSGSVIVHTCKELFMRADELGEIIPYINDEGVKYVTIKFLSKFPNQEIQL